jgi:hypothetical protein
MGLRITNPDTLSKEGEELRKMIASQRDSELVVT